MTDKREQEIRERRKINAAAWCVDGLPFDDADYLLELIDQLRADIAGLERRIESWRELTQGAAQQMKDAMIARLNKTEFVYSDGDGLRDVDERAIEVIAAELASVSLEKE
jgi:hypothetical protein